MRWDKNLKSQIHPLHPIHVGSLQPLEQIIVTREGELLQVSWSRPWKDTLSDKQKLEISLIDVPEKDNGKWRLNRENQMCFIKKILAFGGKKSTQVRNKSMILQIYWYLKWYVLLKQVYNPKLNALVESWDMGWGIWMMGLKGYHKL